MTYRLGSLLIPALVLLLASPWQASGQWAGAEFAFGGASPGSVMGTGSVSTPLQPTTLRMHIELQAEGKTLQEALLNLKDRREAALVQLEKLKADAKSAKFKNPQRSMDESARRRAMEQMVRSRMRGRTGSQPAAPTSQTLSTVLTIDWPLPAQSPEDCLVVVESLREKVVAANLGGAKAAQERTPEEEELAEETIMLGSDSFGEEAPKPGTPQFVFVASITAEQKQKAMSEAFTEAKEQAEALAVAAGTKLGPLVGLNGNVNSQAANMVYDSFSYQQQQYLQRLMGSSRYGVPGDEKGEVTAMTPEALRFTAVVMASFALQPADR